MQTTIVRPYGESDQQQSMPVAFHEQEERPIIQIMPEDALETVLGSLRFQSEPVILLLSEQSPLFRHPSHFAQLRHLRLPNTISFIVPQSRYAELSSYARHYGFVVISVLDVVRQSLSQSYQQWESPARQDGEKQPLFIKAEQDQIDEAQQKSLSHWTSPAREANIVTFSSPFTGKHPTKKRIGLIASLIAFLIIGGAILPPILFTEQPGLMSSPSMVTTVGQISFASSGQLDQGSSKGLNDIVSVRLHNLTHPATGKAYYAWLFPDVSDENTTPLLLGKVALIRGQAQLTYVHPDHSNMLARYSRFAIAEQESDRQPATPPLDTRAIHYVGSIPDAPTPGDEHHYSQRDHIRHLLAKDPTLEQIGIQGGLDIWLYRNAGKILEWASAARDSWASGQKSDLDLVHRHMLRIMDYLDGSAYVSASGDVPADSPLVVDPLVSRIGLLEVSQTQVLPAYLTHVDIHLQGLMRAPGHTEAQQQLAIKLDTALKQDAALMKNVRQDASTLSKMETSQLKGTDALALLNDLVTNATNAYVGQFDAKGHGTINGIVWIHHELQELATMSITTTLNK